MKIKITKFVYHAILVDGQELMTLVEFLSNRFQKLTVSASCLDGTVIETEDIADVVNFENPNFRQIQTIEMHSYVNSNENFSLSLQSKKGNSFSAYYKIHLTDDATALRITDEVLKRLKEMKPWYDYLARVKSAYVFGIPGIVYGLYIFLQILLGNRQRVDMSPIILDGLYVMFWFGILYVALLQGLDWVQAKLYPRVFFLIGKQKKHMENLDRWRRFIWGGFLLAIITGIIGNFLSSFIM